MTQYQITRGNELNKSINVRKDELRKWNENTNFYYKEITIGKLNDQGNIVSGEAVNLNYVPLKSMFTVIKAMAVMHLTQDIEKLEKELNEL